MSTAGDIYIDFLYEFWALQYYRVFISLVIFWIVYIFIKNGCLIDVAWPFNHFLIGLGLFIKYNTKKAYSKPILEIIFLAIWFLRLGGFLFVTRILTSKSDPRYERLSERFSNKTLYFFFQFQFQGILTMFTSIPLYFLFRMPRNLDIPFYIGIVLTIIGIIGEAISDYQLNEYKIKKSKNLISDDSLSRDVLRDGFWKYSRHPNLFFELIIWIGFALSACNDYYSIFGFIGVIILFLLINFVTVPITEKSMKKRRSEEVWNSYIQSTNKYIPFIKL